MNSQSNALSEALESLDQMLAWSEHVTVSGERGRLLEAHKRTALLILWKNGVRGRKLDVTAP